MRSRLISAQGNINCQWAIEDTSKKMFQSDSKSLFLLSIASSEIFWIDTSLISCQDLLDHLIAWQKYSLSEDEIEQIRSSRDEIVILRSKLGRIFDGIYSFSDDEAVISSSLGELRKKITPQMDFCQKLAERLSNQNPLMKFFFN